MASFPTEHRFASFDGAEIAWRELGHGRPVVLLHGLFSNAQVNWLKFGTAARIADAGFRVVMPDLRAHGGSAAPCEAAAYPPDVLALDIEALIAHLSLTDYDLGGFSLGGRTTARLLARGARPRRAVIAGMGLRGIADSAPGTRWFLDAVANRDAHARGSEEFFAVQFMRTNGIAPDAATHVLHSQVDTPVAELRTLTTPTLVVCGAEDQYFPTARELADVLPNVTWREIPGTHMSSVTKPELGAAIAEYLTA